MAGVSQSVDRKPIYCDQDGATLTEYTFRRDRGYDLYTGEKNRGEPVMKLQCPHFINHKEWTMYTRSDGTVYWHTIG